MPDSKRMRVGQIPLSDNYRQAVGPEDKYDLIGAHQFSIMIREGLREWHKMLDVGCGSLRGGKLFIPYLQTGNYYGVEPNADLVLDGIKYELGADTLKSKSPSFHFSKQFDLDHWGDVRFDFILAQSIFTHSTQAQATKCITEVAKVLTEDGKFLATFIQGSYDETNFYWSRPIVRRTPGFFESLTKEHGLVYTKLSNTAHPNKLTWFRMERGN